MTLGHSLFRSRGMNALVTIALEVMQLLYTLLDLARISAKPSVIGISSFAALLIRTGQGH